MGLGTSGSKVSLGFNRLGLIFFKKVLGLGLFGFWFLFLKEFRLIGFRWLFGLFRRLGQGFRSLSLVGLVVWV